ncbi:MAG: hypothetical protein GWM87_12745 [Xanthomonadales bacterium]|nr:hypothetical protein [Xanthomonadales bacterium]NIX13704.1 hypothetical protein [Xanthomonadales bacterium]
MDSEDRPIGISILALITALAGVLGLFLAGSMLLIGTGASWAASVIPLLLLGPGYLLLAWTLWSRRNWSRSLAYALLGAVLVAGLASGSPAERMDLGMTVVLVLAAAVNIAVVMALFLPANRAWLGRRS